MPVAISFNLKIKSGGQGAGGPMSPAYHFSRGPAPSAPFSSLLLPSVLALVCAWAVLPAFVGSTHPTCCDSDFCWKIDTCLKCKPGPSNGGGGPQITSFEERKCTRGEYARENVRGENCLIILLKEERRYTRITLGFCSQGIERFIYGDRGVFVCGGRGVFF